MKKAVVLLSGGLDSATTLYIAKAKGYEVSCLIFDYGQRHARELNSAVKIARFARCKYHILKISLPWKGSALLDDKIKIPIHKKGKFSVVTNRIPPTYVPARNTIFISFAISFAEATGADSIFIGANAVDFSGYPDCRPRYYKIFNKLIMRATKKGIEGERIKIHTPLIKYTKAEIIKKAKKLRVPLKHTWSCYKGGKAPCGVCDSCKLREKGFASLNMEDPSYD